MRTFQAALILLLALASLVIGVHGFRLQSQIRAEEERRATLEANVKRAKELSVEQLALTYRLKKLYGSEAQKRAAGAPAVDIDAVTAEIREVEQKLRSIRRELEEIESTEAGAPPSAFTPHPAPAATSAA